MVKYKGWSTVLINGIHSNWTGWPQPHSLYAHVNTNWLHMDLSVFVKKNSVWFCIKNLELRRILMSSFQNSYLSQRTHQMFELFYCFQNGWNCIMIYKDALCPVTYITLLVGEIFVKGIVAKAIQSIKVHHNALNVDNRY